MNGMPSPASIAAAKGYIAFRSGRRCPYDHFTQPELVDAFYIGMAKAELAHAAAEREPTN